MRGTVNVCCNSKVFVLNTDHVESRWNLPKLYRKIFLPSSTGFRGDLKTDIYEAFCKTPLCNMTSNLTTEGKQLQEQDKTFEKFSAIMYGQAKNKQKNEKKTFLAFSSS